MGLSEWRAIVAEQMDAYGFTPAERRVAWYLYRSLTNREIAHELSVTEGTVKNHVTAMLGKTHTVCRVGLIVALLRLDEEDAA